jgi:mono/diheme cytochrome c family protein
MTRLEKALHPRLLAQAALGVSLLLVVSCSRTEPTQEVAPAEPAPVSENGQAVAPETKAAGTDRGALLAQAKDLFVNHCAACHGETGDGRGDAAKWLYPRPRNFRSAEFRIVTTTNGIPSDADLLAVLDRGMPGSAMPPFSHLPQSDKTALVAYVRDLSARGIEQQLLDDAKAFGDEPDRDEVAEMVAARTHPGEVLMIPALDAVSPEAVARGAKVYAEACAACHGTTGKGDGTERQFNSDGSPTRPRDFTRGIFKGRPEPQDLYARVRAGMPGSPMPAERVLTDEQISDLIAFVLSLSDEATRAQAVLQRRNILAHRVEETLTDDPASPVWSAAEAVPLTMTPLWWQDYEDLAVQIEALHDGKSLAVRMSWRDSTENMQAVRPQEFEDMAAVQWFKGSPEPFLGMGNQSGPVDVWLWQPSRQAPLARRPDVDTAYPNMVVDMYPFEQPTDGPRPHATELQNQAFVTAWAAGNPRSDPTSAGSTNLEAAGFGTLTARPPVSQLTTAGASWSDGRWTVVLRRALDVEAGLALAPGERLSIAFAIWDGTARDRNGQKRITVWQDLELE